MLSYACKITFGTSSNQCDQMDEKRTIFLVPRKRKEDGSSLGGKGYDIHGTDDNITKSYLE